MNDKHQGPHCAGSCEGAAYNIEIQRKRTELTEALKRTASSELDAEMLRAENDDLREAAREVLGAMSPTMIRGVPLEKFDSRMDAATSRLKTMLAAHDKEGE